MTTEHDDRIEFIREQIERQVYPDGLLLATPKVVEPLLDDLGDRHEFENRPDKYEPL